MDSIKEENEYCDFEKGMKIASGNTELYKLLLHKFISYNSKFIDNFKMSLKLKDYNQAKKQIHTLKNKSSNIGGEKLCKISEKVEIKIDDSNINIINSNLLISLEEILVKTMNEVNIYLKKFDRDEKDSLVLFGEFVKLLYEDFFEAKILFELQISNLDLIPSENLDELKDYMATYEKEKAIKIAEKIKSNLK